MIDIKAIEAVNNEVKYDKELLIFFLKQQEKVKELSEKFPATTIEELEDYKNTVISFYRKETLIDFDTTLLTLEIENIEEKYVEDSQPILMSVDSANTKIRGLKVKKEIKEVDAGYYLNIKSIEFNTKIKDLDLFLESDFNKLDLIYLIINELKKTNKISYCKDNKKEICEILNKLKKRKNDLLITIDLINKLEKENLDLINKMLKIMNS